MNALELLAQFTNTLPDYDWIAEAGSWIPGGERQPGAMLVLTGTPEGGGGVWALRLGDVPPPPKTVVLLREANAAWKEARNATTRSIIVLTRAIESLESVTPHLLHICSTGFGPLREDRLDGRSIGLPFALALASYVLQKPIDPRFVASAEIDPATGRLVPVELLPSKVAALSKICPTGWTLLVAESQAASPMEAGSLERALRPVDRIVRCETLDDAFRVVFGEEWIDEVIQRSGEHEQSRERVVARLFRHAMGGRQSADSWHTVASAAERARRWPVDAQADVNTTKHRADTLHFIESVALRLHGIDSPPLGMPSGALDPEWLASFPPDDQVGIVVHWVQHSTDTGQPAPDAAIAFAKAFLPNTERLWLPEHAKLAGAVGRLIARSEFDLEEAWHYQSAAIRYWLTRGCRQSLEVEVAYPLSESYLLASWMDPGAFHARCALLDAIWLDVRATMSTSGRGWTVLMRARAMVVHGVSSQLAQAIELLGRTALDLGLRADVRLSAARWQIRALLLAGKVDAAHNRFTALLQEAAATDARRATDFERQFYSLVPILSELDFAVLTGTDESLLALVQAAIAKGGWQARLAIHRARNENSGMSAVARALIDRYPY